MVVATTECDVMNKKTIRVSKKRQITIPLEFYEKLNLGNEVECALKDGAVIIRPIRRNLRDDFSEELLEELISKGLSGQELMEQFRIERANFKQGAQKMLKEAEEIALGTKPSESFEDVFGSEE